MVCSWELGHLCGCPLCRRPLGGLRFQRWVFHTSGRGGGLPVVVVLLCGRRGLVLCVRVWSEPFADGGQRRILGPGRDEIKPAMDADFARISPLPCGEMAPSTRVSQAPGPVALGGVVNAGCGPLTPGHFRGAQHVGEAAMKKATVASWPVECRTCQPDDEVQKQQHPAPKARGAVGQRVINPS